MDLVQGIKKTGSTILKIIYPEEANCAICGAETSLEENCGVCRSCVELLAPKAYNFLVYSDSKQIQGYAPFTHYDYAKDIVHALKYEEKPYLSVPLARFLAWVCKEFRLDADIVVCVPLHETRKRQRGYNQSEKLATELANALGIGFEDCLKRVKNTRTQIDLGINERRENVKNAFETINAFSVQGKRILLVDDVCTSGSTCMACAETLFQSGASDVTGVFCTFTGITIMQ